MAKPNRPAPYSLRQSTMTSHPPRLVLRAQTAQDVMSSNPISVRANATLPEALSLFVDRGFKVAPVIDEAGRAVGVLSRADVLLYERSGKTRTGTPERLPPGFSEEVVNPVRVSELMSPVIYSVRPQAPIWEVLQQLLQLQVHHIFVMDKDGVLVGVISALDILNRIVLD